MRFKLLVVLFVLSLTAPARAQGPVTFYFPIITKGACMPACEDHWKIVTPAAATNHVLNPSFGLATNYTATGAAVLTRSAGNGRYGLYGLNVTSNGDGEGLYMNLIASGLSNAVHFVTVRAKGVLPSTWRWALGSQFRTPVLIESIDNEWDLWGATFPAAEANGSTRLYLVQGGGGATDYYIDGVQVEQSSYWTTFINGDQPGCKWNATEHASTSTRGAQSRAGGRVRDLAEDYSFFVESFSGTGTSPVRLSVDDYALLPGGELNAVKIQPRRFVLTGTIFAESEKELYAKRQALAQALDPAAYDRQPVLIRFTGSEVQKETATVYEGGLEGDLAAFLGDQQRDTLSGEWNQAQVFTERVALRFLSPSPFWYGIGDEAAALDLSDAPTLRYVTGRLRSTGQWDDLGLTANPVGAGDVFAVAWGPDGLLYAGGNFTGLNGTVAPNNIDYIASYNPTTDTWAAVGAVGDLNGTVYALLFDAAGDLYVGGEFTNAGSVPAADYIARWDGAAWNAVDTPNQGAAAITNVRALAIDATGQLYAGGTFLNFANVADADGIAVWDGASWAAVGGAATTTGVLVIAINRAGTVFAGGSFSNFASVADADFIAQFDGSSWSGVGGGLNNIVWSLAVSRDDTLYLGGDFTGAGGTTANFVASWNGQTYAPLGAGVDNRVYDLVFDPGGSLLLAGSFTIAGGLTLPGEGLARWNSNGWSIFDINLPGSASVYALAIGDSDPTVEGRYDLWAGFSTTGSATVGGAVTATNSGTVQAFPRVVIERTGGAISDAATIATVINEDLALALYSRFVLQAGERLTINLTPTTKSIISSFRGSVPEAILLPSDFGPWRLAVGDTTVSALVTVTGTAAASGYLVWRPAFLGLD